MKFNIRILAVVALLAFATGALLIAACGDDDDNGAAAQVEQEQFDALKEQVTKTSILAAATVISVEALHDLDESASAASAIDESWERRATRMRRAFASVGEWPSEMQAKADLTLEKLTALEEAIADGNLDDVKTLAPEAHDAWHELEHDANAYIAGEEHEDEGDDSDHAEGDNSPSASAAGH